jgi:hypothetical protein
MHEEAAKRLRGMGVMASRAAGAEHRGKYQVDARVRSASDEMHRLEPRVRSTS